METTHHKTVTIVLVNDKDEWLGGFDEFFNPIFTPMFDGHAYMFDELGDAKIVAQWLVKFLGLSGLKVYEYEILSTRNIYDVEELGVNLNG